MKTFLAVAVTLILWSSAFAGIKEGLAGYSPGHLVLMRFLVASAVFLLYACTGKIRLPRKEDLPKIIGLSLAGITIYHSCLTFGEMAVPAGTAGLLIASVPAFTAVFCYLLFKERMTKLGWSGIIIGFVGVAVISFGTHQTFAFATGAILILIAAISTTLFFILQKPLFSRYSAVELTAYFTWFGTVPMLMFSHGIFEAVAAAPAASTWSAVYLGVLPSAFAYITWAIALKNAPASLVASGLYINPLLAIFIAWIWLGEVPHSIAFFGGVFIIAGVILVNFFGQRKTKIKRKHAAG
ncbi:EamA-like transporter family protein [Scopulibacillus darangshiensis]|uniref:EamA-like transporter family protein n=1 Tax=Scopulibacillus darangshiensis TaxID=442528 RepID=A0A4R2NBW1_9BACL|nr:EamA family transporter [Scopulibacillus darangshiensis]TCP18623.1 EamA-like transporter family protein [Scopulibacillus darangshiensis]